MVNVSKLTVGVAFFLLLSSIPAQAIKILHGPYLQNVYGHEATVVWESDVNSIGWVELCPNDGTNFYAMERPRFYDTGIGIKRNTRLHAVRLTGLQPGTTYRYRVYSQEVKERNAYSSMLGHFAATDVFGREPLRFTTLDASKPETSFVVINDLHERDSLFKSYVKYSDLDQRDMVIFNGDMMNSFRADSVYFKGFMDTASKLFASEKPLYYVRGNHETRGPIAEYFHDYTCPRQPHLYFTWQQGPVFFIALDTGEDKPDDDIEYYGFNQYDAYRSEEARWLQEVVNSDAYKKAKYHVVIGHIPPAMDKSAWHGDIEVRQKFIPILNNARVDLMICAHTHRFSYHPHAEGINFPLVINSNNSVLYGETNNGRLTVKISDLKGKVIFNETYSSK